MEQHLNPADCEQAARYLKEAAPHAKDPELVQLCAAAVTALVHEGAAYIEGAKLSGSFLRELQECVATICREHPQPVDHVYDSAFCIMECLAVITRESTGKTGKKLPLQEEIMRFFETSGHWSESDETLVSQYYHRLIPKSLAASAH